MSAIRSLFIILTVILSGLLKSLVISDLDFEGNFLIADQSLQAAIFSAPGAELDQKILQADMVRISELYNRKGFPDVIISNPEIITSRSDQARVVFRIREDRIIRIDRVNLTGNSYLSTASILEQTGSGVLSLPELSFLPEKIVSYYTRQGFLFAEAILDSITVTGDGYEAWIRITENKPGNFTEFRFQGNKVTRENTLLRLSALNRSGTITPELLKQAEVNIRSRPYIKDCRIIPLDNRQIFFEVVEDRMTIFSGLLGFNNSASREDRLTGYASLEFLNLFGTDRSLAVFWQKQSSRRELIEMSYHESGFTQIPVNADFTIAREEVDSTYVKTDLESRIYYYDLFNRYGLYLNLDQIYPGSRRPKIVEKTDFTRIGVFWEYNSLDNRFNPSSGRSFHVLFYNIMNRESGENRNKNAVETDLLLLRKLGPKLITSFNSGIRLIENKRLSSFEVFYLGGHSDLRGFLEKQFSGFRTGWANLELRYLLSYYSRVFLFCDYGYVENLEYKAGKLFSFGLGLRMNTRLGLLGIDYGVGYSQGKLRSLQDGIIHFSIETKL